MERVNVLHEFSPEKYGMMFCPICYGDGKTSHNEGEESVCTFCGGFDWIRRESVSQHSLKRIPVRYGASSY